MNRLSRVYFLQARGRTFGDDAGYPAWIAKRFGSSKRVGIVKSGSKRLPTVGVVLEIRQLA